MDTDGESGRWRVEGDFVLHEINGVDIDGDGYGAGDV